MDADEHGYLFSEETYRIIGAAIEVMNALGHGFSEKSYENALCIEFTNRRIPFVQQPRFSLRYKEQTIGEFIPDIITYENIIIDTKTVEQIGSAEKGQMINYLKVTGLKLGLLINFKHPKVQWERIIHDIR